MPIYTERKLAKFDIYCKGTPIVIEKQLKKLIPSAKILKNNSIYLQMLSRLALAQAAQKKFKSAHKTLDKAEKEITKTDTVAKVRLILERGRVLMLSNNIEAAKPFIKKAYNLSKKFKLDNFTIDAAHIMAALVNKAPQKIRWNQIAINVATKSGDKQIKEDWLVILFQCIGLNYIEAKQFKKSLLAFKQSKKLVKKTTPRIVVLGANIGIAKSLRLLNIDNKALHMQLKLLKKCHALSKKTSNPIEVNLFYGWIYEELTEIYLKKAKSFASLAYMKLSKDVWHKQHALGKLIRLKNFKKLR